MIQRISLSSTTLSLARQPHYKTTDIKAAINKTINAKPQKQEREKDDDHNTIPMPTHKTPSSCKETARANARKRYHAHRTINRYTIIKIEQRQTHPHSPQVERRRK